MSPETTICPKCDSVMSTRVDFASCGCEIHRVALSECECGVQTMQTLAVVGTVPPMEGVRL